MGGLEREILRREIDGKEKEMEEMLEKVKKLEEEILWLKGEERKLGEEKEGLRESGDGYTRNLIDFEKSEVNNILTILNQYYNKAKVFFFFFFFINYFLIVFCCFLFIVFFFFFCFSSVYHLPQDYDSKVVSFADPNELLDAFSSAGVALPLSLPPSFSRSKEHKEGGGMVSRKEADLEKIVSLFLHYSVNTAHPFFLNQLYARVDEGFFLVFFFSFFLPSSFSPHPPHPQNNNTNNNNTTNNKVGLLADLMISYVNTNVHTFEVAPVLTLVEREVVRACCAVVGYGEEESEGLFVPGGAVRLVFNLNFFFKFIYFCFCFCFCFYFYFIFVLFCFGFVYLVCLFVFGCWFLIYSYSLIVFLFYLS